MSGDSTIARAAKEITLSDLEDYVNNIVLKKNGMRCYVCGCDNWELGPDPGDNTKPVIVTALMPFVPNGGIWSFPLVCENCGNMLFINVNKLIKFKASKKK